MLFSDALCNVYRRARNRVLDFLNLDQPHADENFCQPIGDLFEIGIHPLRVRHLIVGLRRRAIRQGRRG